MTFAELPQDGLSASEPVDRRIASLLSVWAHDPERVMDDGRNVEQHIARLLEPVLCDAFTYHSEGAKQGWWSDGVFDLRIQRIAQTAFRTIGLTWWAGRNASRQFVAPFEVEFYFDAEDSLGYRKTVVRFGWKDKNGKLRSFCSLHPRLRKDDHEIENSKWGMAIELTPPEDQ